MNQGRKGMNIDTSIIHDYTSTQEVGIMNKKRGWKGAHFESDEGASTDRRVFNIRPLEGYYCNQDYDLELYESNEITEEGLLLLGKLKPKVST